MLEIRQVAATGLIFLKMPPFCVVGKLISAADRITVPRLSFQMAHSRYLGDSRMTPLSHVIREEILETPKAVNGPPV